MIYQLHNAEAVVPATRDVEIPPAGSSSSYFFAVAAAGATESAH